MPSPPTHEIIQHGGRPVTYAIAGRLLRLEATDDWAAAAAEKFLSGWHLDRQGPATRDPAADCTLRVYAARTPPSPPRGGTAFDLPHGRCHAAGDEYLLEVGDSVVTVGRPASGLVEVWFGPTERARRPVGVVNVLSYALQAALRRCGLFDLHAACAVDPVGRGVLVVGPSGSGKSTLTLQLAARGWRYLTDDMLILTESGGAVEARAFRRLFSISEEAALASRVGGAVASLGAAVASDPSKRRFDPAPFFPGAFAEACRPASVWFARISRAPESRAAKLSPAEAMTRLIRHCPWASYDGASARGYLRVLAALASQCEAWALDAGLDILADPARSAALLSTRA